MKENPMANAIVKVQGSPGAQPTLLGQMAPRIPTGGKIRPGIMVLTRKAAERPEAKAIYARGVAEGHSFEQIERTLAEAIPQLKLRWCRATCRGSPCESLGFRQPGDRRGRSWTPTARIGARAGTSTAFPVVFPSDHWQTVMPHELAAWSTHEKRFWSQYSPDGTVRHCMRLRARAGGRHGRRTIRIFGGRKVVPREENGVSAIPSPAWSTRQRECNLTGRFLFFIPGIRSISALELPTTSFYAMSAAIQRFQAIALMRGGRISGLPGP
jgi:hypothetical protein